MPISYQYLTDRGTAPQSAITGNTLIHIVDPNDVSQNPAGSSYKAELTQLFSIFSSGDTYVTGATYTDNKFTFTNNFGNSFDVEFNTVTGLTSSGVILTDTISATTYQNFPTQDLETTLSYGNTSGVYDIQMGSGRVISSSNLGGQIELDYSLTPGQIFISTDSGLGGETFIFMEPTGGSFGTTNNSIGIRATGVDINVNDTFLVNGIYNTNTASDLILTKDNASTSVTTSSDDKPGILIGTVSSTVNSGVKNSVIIAGNSLTATQDETLYIGNLNIGVPPVNNNSNIEILSRNSISGNIEYVDANSITGGTDTFVTGGTYSAGTATFTNNTGGTFVVTGFTSGDTNFANTDLTFTNDRIHNTNGNELTITSDLSYTDAYIYLQPGLTGNELVQLFKNGQSVDVFNSGITLNYNFNSGLFLTNGLLSLNESKGYDVSIKSVGSDYLFFSDNLTDRIGIGTNLPSEKLDVSGKTKTINFQMTSGATNGYVLTSDASGNASWQVSTGSGTFTGGTVLGETFFSNGLSANTISASTYLNLPLDDFATGLTFNTGTYQLSIDGENGILDTVNLSILSSDLNITGGTYDSLTGVGTFTNNTGGTFSVSGFLVGYTDSFVTGGTYNQNTGSATFTTSSGLTFSVTGFTVGSNYLAVTGGTVSGNTLFQNGLTATTISATTYQNLPIDIRVTGATYSNNTFTYRNNTGGTFSVLFNTVTGLTSTGTIISPTISATTYQNLPTDIRVTGGTYSNTTGTATFRNNTGGTFNVTGLTTGITITNNVNNNVLTATGTDNVINGESNMTFNGTTLSLTKDSTVAPNLLIIDTGSTLNDAFIRFAGQANGTPSYAMGVDKSQLNRFEIAYANSSSTNLNSGTVLSISTGGTVNTSLESTTLPSLSVGNNEQLKLFAFASGLAGSRIIMANATSPTLNTTFTQFSNYYEINANSGGTAGQYFYINSTALSGITSFGGGGINDSVLIYSDARTDLPTVGGSGLFVRYNARINGTLSKAAGSFQIDHPLENLKETHTLTHSFIEGPQADNIYRGRVNLTNGIVTVNIDEVSNMTQGTFEALNTDIQCFTSNETGWDAVKGSINGNILTIESNNPNCSDTISWMVIGERQDEYYVNSSMTDENGKLIVEIPKR